MPEPAHEFGHGCTSLRREHGPRVPQVVPAQIRSPDLVPGLPPRPLKTGSAEPVARGRSQDESFAAGTDMILEMGLDHRAVSYTHLRAHETVLDLVCRLL